MDDKSIKEEFRKKAQASPNSFYPVVALKELGFKRNKCSKCGQFFWSADPERKICGDAACAGGFHFIGNSPAKKKLDYIGAWKAFSKIHKKLGYTAVDRYPVVARWNPTTDFTIASIAAFQPFVVSGEVDPPANPLVIPQFCLRFNDIDNVGITGAHYVGFVMMGQHAFIAPKDYNINRYFRDHLTWLNSGMGLDNSHITIHEDAWAGGGNFGPSVEFHSAGLEISNQVYMQYEATTSGNKELGIKVLDMGQGQERVPWFTQGEMTSYETTFPTVIKKLRGLTGLDADKELMRKFLPYAAWLNVDEIADADAAWKKVSARVGVPVKELRAQIQQQAALYSVAEHSRALLFALNDSALPSNVGGGYNLRVILRRILSFIDQYKWNISLPDICSLHAAYLKPLFPELSRHLDDVSMILDVEKNKYENTRQKAHNIVKSVLKKKVTDDILLRLYDSHGISPEIIREEAVKEGILIKVPDNFYARVASMHEIAVQPHETGKEILIDLGGIKATEALYFDGWKPPKKFTAEALKIAGTSIVLDKTWFYPTSGGQLHDIGYIGAYKVIDVVKHGPHIIHIINAKPKFSEGSRLACEIDIERRKQLAQHHTSTHIINAAARKVLGNHINQAGAKKTVEKGSIDITHFSRLADDEIFKIENEANLIVKKKIRIKKSFMLRSEAEKRFGTEIYQGGVAPGRDLRIVEIQGVDVEACGGTHLNNTSEAELIHIISASKIADDVVRLEFVAGKAARSWAKEMEETGKAVNKFVLKNFGADVKVSAHSMQRAAEVFAVPAAQLKAALEKFSAAVMENSRLLKKLHDGYSAVEFSSGSLDRFCRQLFEQWKSQEKQIAALQSKKVSEHIKNLSEKQTAQLDHDADVLRDIAAKFREILLLNNEGMFAFRGSAEKFKELVSRFGARGGGKDVQQGKVSDVKKVLREFRF